MSSNSWIRCSVTALRDLPFPPIMHWRRGPTLARTALMPRLDLRLARRYAGAPSRLSCLPALLAWSLSYMLSALMTWQHNYAPIAGSLGLSALVAAIPIVVLFIMLGGAAKAGVDGGGIGACFRRCSCRSSSYGMPARLALISTLYGAAYGIFPIAWIVFSSIMLYRMAVDTGKFEIIKESVGGLTSDRRLQAMFIAFSFGAFIEGAAGLARRWPSPARCSRASDSRRSTPPASACWRTPRRSRSDRSAYPVTTLANVTGLPVLALSAMVGRLCAMISIIIPGYLIVVMAGWKRAVEVLPAIVACGVSFAGDAVLRVELPRARADRHSELAHVHRRDGVRVEALGRRRTSSGSKATSRRRST